jgi:hypothetical protein
MAAKQIGTGLKVVLLGTALLALAGVPLLVWSTIGFMYSSGGRVGFVRSVSERGWACKTYTGDLLMANKSEQAGQVFEFTVRDKNLADRIEQLDGHRVALYYEHRKGIPSICQGATEYFATDVRNVE